MLKPNIPLVSFNGGWEAVDPSLPDQGTQIGCNVLKYAKHLFLNQVLKFYKIKESTIYVASRGLKLLKLSLNDVFYKLSFEDLLDCHWVVSYTL